jgi:catalase
MFFIRDPAKFPDLIHAQRRDLRTNLMNPNMWWDWVCNNHESLHMVLWLYSEFGTMFNYRSQSGYVGHAYKWVMPDGSWKYVHFFLSSDRGQNLSEGDKVKEESMVDPDSAMKDFYEAIERGDYPTWTANVQVVDPEDAHKLGFNILDFTKQWNLGSYPQDIDVIPSRPFGKLTLKRNPENYLAEIEQLAFSPSNLVPGIEASEDPILQARMFAYADARRYRLGPNHEQLSTNQSKFTPNPPLRNRASTSTDTYGTHLGSSKETKGSDAEFNAWIAKVSSKEWSQPNEMDYKFPREFWKVLPTLRSPEFQNSIVVNIAQSLSQACEETRRRVYGTLTLVAADLSQRVREATEKVAEDEARFSWGKLVSPKL